LTVHVMINVPDSKEHTGSHDLIVAIHREKNVSDSNLDSLNLGRLFYFLWPGKHTPSHFNLVRPSGNEQLSFNEDRRPVNHTPWTRSTGPWTYSTNFSLVK
jgi:hypothetical protein